MKDILVEISNWEQKLDGEEIVGFDSLWQIKKKHKRELRKILRKWYNEENF